MAGRLLASSWRSHPQSSVPYVERRGHKLQLGPHGIDALGEPHWQFESFFAEPVDWDVYLRLMDLLDDQ